MMQKIKDFIVGAIVLVGFPLVAGWALLAYIYKLMKDSGKMRK